MLTFSGLQINGVEAVTSKLMGCPQQDPSSWCQVKVYDEKRTTNEVSHEKKQTTALLPFRICPIPGGGAQQDEGCAGTRPHCSPQAGGSH